MEASGSVFKGQSFQGRRFWNSPENRRNISAFTATMDDFRASAFRRAKSLAAPAFPLDRFDRLDRLDRCTLPQTSVRAAIMRGFP
jgi:hypothetical protein